MPPFQGGALGRYATPPYNLLYPTGNSLSFQEAQKRENELLRDSDPPYIRKPYHRATASAKMLSPSIAYHLSKHQSKSMRDHTPLLPIVFLLGHFAMRHL